MAFLIPSIIIQGVYTGVISTISMMTMGTYTMAKSIYTHKNPDVNKLFNELDLVRNIKIVESFIKKHAKEILADEEDFNDRMNLANSYIFEVIDQIHGMDRTIDPVKLSVFYLLEIIKEINQELEVINNKVINHEKKWFSSWRSLHVSKNTEKIKLNAKLLNERFDSLIRLLAI